MSAPSSTLFGAPAAAGLSSPLRLHPNSFDNRFFHKTKWTSICIAWLLLGGPANSSPSQHDGTRFLVTKRPDDTNFFSSIARLNSCEIPGPPALFIIPWNLYPAESRKRNEQGTVILQLFFDPDGCVRKALSIGDVSSRIRLDSGRPIEPFPGAGSAMRTTWPTTRAAFPRRKILDCALDSAIARRFLLGRGDPANPFVSRQRRQILPSRPRHGSRAEGRAHISRDFVHGSGFSLVLCHHPPVSSCTSGARLRCDASWHRPSQ
jgi:hypothetical protein